MPITRRAAAVAAVTAASLAAASPALAQSDRDTGGPTAYAVDGAGRLRTFDIERPAAAHVRPVTGLPSRSTIVGIDERPKTGQLYAVVTGASGAASAWTIDPSDASASFAFDLVTTAGLPVTLQGTAGVDFNPVADALRIVTSTGQNLRALPSDRVASGVFRTAGTTFVDGALSYQPIGTTGRTTATGIVEAAYTNNLPAPATTTLFDVDASLADLVVQNPPNDGTLTKRADLALAGRPVQGFDIRTTATDVAYVVLGDTTIRDSDARFSRIFTLDLATGTLTPGGRLPTNDIVDLALDTP